MEDVLEKPIRFDAVSRALAKYSARPAADEDSEEDTPGPSTPASISPCGSRLLPRRRSLRPSASDERCPAEDDTVADTLDGPLPGFRTLSSLRSSRQLTVSLDPRPPAPLLVRTPQPPQ
eukprot:EG_transcript_52036